MHRVVLRSIAKLAIVGSFFLPIISSAQAVEVYLFRGAGDLSFVNENLHFSGGLEEIADQMNAEGIHAEVRRFEAIDDAMRTIRKRKPSSVAFIGHSMGALASMNMARRMRAEGVRVVYIGLIDIPGPVGVAGDNVEWAENFYSIYPVYGLFTNARRHPRAENIHVTGYIHNRMDNSPFVQKRLLNAVREVHYEEQRKLQEAQQPQSVETYQQPSLAPTAQPQPQPVPTPSYNTQSQPVPIYNTQPEPAYTPPLPNTDIGTVPIPQNDIPYGIDPNPTSSVQPSYQPQPAYQPPQDEGILAKAERFLNRITTRSGYKKTIKPIENNR